MWYKETKEKELDYSKPIIAEDNEGNKCLLLPQIEKSSYDVVGYNWFNIDNGEYGSSIFFKTVKDAINARSSYIIYNCKIIIKE